MEPLKPTFSFRLRAALEVMVRLPKTEALATLGFRVQLVAVVPSPSTRLLTFRNLFPAVPVPSRVSVLPAPPRSTMPVSPQFAPGLKVTVLPPPDLIA